jgi:hypothetical protein
MTYKSGKLVGRIQVWDIAGNVQEDWEYPLELPLGSASFLSNL